MTSNDETQIPWPIFKVKDRLSRWAERWSRIERAKFQNRNFIVGKIKQETVKRQKDDEYKRRITV